MGYNGWTNQDTWIVGSWSGNDLELCARSLELMGEFLRVECLNISNPEVVRAKIIQYYGEAIQVARVNGDNVNIQQVNWEELIEVFMEDYAEYKKGKLHS